MDRVHAAAKQTDAAHHHGNLALVDIIAAHRGITVGQCRLKLRQRDGVSTKAVVIGLHFVAPHRPAETHDAYDALDGAELAFEHPILERLDVIERVNLPAIRTLGDFEDIAVDFTGGRLGRDARGHAGWKRLADGGHAVDDFLAA